MRVSPRASGDLRCPYCHDDVRAGPTCAGCGARYHEECAQIFGSCAVRACGGELELARAVAQVLPRLPELARRVGRCELTGVAALGDGGPRMLVLDLPCSSAIRRSPQPAARVVGEFLGQTVYDGRLRVLSPFPEPLVRLRSQAEAEQACARLASVGLQAIAPLVEEVIRPFRPFCVRRYDLDPERLYLESTRGQRVELPRNLPRFVMTSRIVTRSAPHLAGAHRSSIGYAELGRIPARLARVPQDQREEQRCVYVYRSAQEPPFLFLQREVEPVGRAAADALPEGVRFRRLLDTLAAPRQRRHALPDVLCDNDAFFVPLDAEGRKRTNGPFVALVARLRAHAWAASKNSKGRR